MVDSREGREKRRAIITTRSTEFWRDTSKPLEILKVLGSNARLKSAHAARMVLNELYDEIYGICDHLDESRPLSLVALHPAEDNLHESLYADMVRRYTRNGILKHFGLSLKDYLDLTAEEAAVLDDEGQYLIEEEAKLVANFADNPPKET